MIVEPIHTDAELDDKTFDARYPLRYRAISEFHFTPVKVAQVVAEFLVQKPGTRVLDVGSGAGKFCMVGAASTQGHFTGVEQRKSLHDLAIKTSKNQHSDQLEFIHSNIMEIDFTRFDAIYYYNSFYEHIFKDSAIDQTLTLDKNLYTLYTQFMREQLSKMPVGTRLATYFSFMDEVPEGYKVLATDFDLKLKLWEKKKMT
jgi:tRNA A58 N-methylase Trm61